KIPIGLAAIQFGEKQEQFEAALDAEVNFSYRKGLLRVDILLGRVPDHIGFDKIVSMGANSFQVEFHALMNSLPFELPFIVGYGRQGWLYSGLVDCPHLLVAGQTGAGKSNFLHTLISCLMQVDCVIHIIDLKRVEFSYLKKHLTVKHSLNGAIETLEFLTAEMQRRMAFLDRAGFVSAKEWRKTHPDRANELPYHVLVIDEFSQLCPMLAKEKNDRMVRTYAHKMLVDLICLARSLGIHVVIATQRPDQHILPGQLKANIPATLCFRVRSTTNSQICLDRNGAEKLPSPKEIPGRAIWQHDEEREVQTMYMPINQAKTLMQSQRSKNVIEQACQMGRFRGGMVCSG
ncbi:MAG TPA: DUF87 domain-containing protein, partial [Clostridiaceae bacterium]|nr:DUF87 domain-containing protein [Clostridiaceae bacterium]